MKTFLRETCRISRRTFSVVSRASFPRFFLIFPLMLVWSTGESKLNWGHMEAISCGAQLKPLRNYVIDPLKTVSFFCLPRVLCVHYSASFPCLFYHFATESRGTSRFTSALDFPSHFHGNICICGKVSVLGFHGALPRARGGAPFA